jgi:uncharacterized membrane protein
MRLRDFTEDEQVFAEVHQTLPQADFAGWCNSAVLASWLSEREFQVEVQPQKNACDINHLLFAKRPA